MRYVTSGYLHRLFVEKDKYTILRRPNIRRFVLQYGVPCEQHEKAWLIDFDAFMAAIALREYPPQRGIVRIRSIDNALKEYNKKHKKQATIEDVEACIFNGKVFSYSYWDRAIVNYDELETELEEYMKTVRKDGRPPAGIDG